MSISNGVGIALCLAVIVFFIFAYAICQRGRRPRLGSAARQREPQPTGLDLSYFDSLPNFKHRKSTGRRSNGRTSGDEDRTEVGYSATAAADQQVAEAEAEAEVDCAVCLGAVEEGEMVRLLPNCMHVFHMSCIDMWLYSHTTCPVCRADVRRRPSDEAKTMAALVAAAATDTTELRLDAQQTWLPPV